MSKEPPMIVIDVTLDSMKAQLRQFVNEHLSKDAVNAAIDRAFASFDIYAEIERQAKKAIEEVIGQHASSVSWELQEAIKEATSARVKQLLGPIVAKVTAGIDKEPTDV